jgi:hypothetical protein
VLDKISGAQVEAILSEKLSESADWSMPFEYAVYKEGKPPIFQSEDISMNTKEYKYFRTSLFPGSVYNQRTFISVYFPGERVHIRENPWVIMGGIFHT